MTIYVVTSGEYSDYRIRAMFSTKEAAELYVKEFDKESKYEDADIEEWELDAEAGRRFIPVWKACIDLSSGEVFRRDAHSQLMNPTGPCRVDGPYNSYYGHHYPSRYLIVTSPVSEEHAVKVAVEKRQEWLRSEGEA